MIVDMFSELSRKGEFKLQINSFELMHVTDTLSFVMMPWQQQMLAMALYCYLVMPIGLNSFHSMTNIDASGLNRFKTSFQWTQFGSVLGLYVVLDYKV